MDKKNRQEKNFLINSDEAQRLIYQLSQMLEEDPLNGQTGYSVRDLYFDSVYGNNFFKNAENEICQREIRLRISDPDGDYAMMEMKENLGKEIRKQSLLIPREEAIIIMNGDYTPLLAHSDPFATECYSIMQTQCYRPKVIVEFNRQAFFTQDRQIRVNLDSNFISTGSRLDLFSSSLNMNPIFNSPVSVLEVKYQNYLLDYFRILLNSFELVEISFTKYTLATNVS